MNIRNELSRLEQSQPELIRIVRRIRWWTSFQAAQSRVGIRRLHNQYTGERCFIIGNGPSLNSMDMSHLKGEITFSMNRGYLYYDRIGQPCTYLVAVNSLVLRQWADEITALPNLKFIPWGARRWYEKDENILFLPGALRSEPPRFSTDPGLDFWSGATVTYVALQLAYYMGFKRVILIGVDHRFKSKGTPHATVLAGESDNDHFDPTYFSKGAEWQLPDLETSELAYHLARHTFALAGREVLDATIDGALTVFPKVDYQTLF